MTDKNLLFWLDLETAGLNGRDKKTGIVGADHYPIFEVAGILTDEQLNPVGEPLRLVIFQEEDEIKKGDKVALEMHEKSGLLKEVRESGLTLEQAEKEILALLKKHGAKKFSTKSKQGVVMCGNSIKFDRDFIMYQMPMLDEFMHYRMLDVSAFAMGSCFWNPAVSEELVKEYKHEAMSDIKESIAEALIYKAVFMGKSRESFRAGFEAGAKAGAVDTMDADWVEYRNGQ